MDSKYNYVFFNQADYRFGSGDRKGYYSICLRDLEQVDNVRVYTSIYENLNFFSRWLYLFLSRLLNGKKWNNFWYKKADFYKGWKANKPLCFVFIAYLPVDYLCWLRNNYPAAKFVMFIRDLVATRPEIIKNIQDSGVIDKWISYDQGDADQYGFFFYPEIESKLDLPVPSVCEYDVFFAGVAKKRLPQIVATYDKLVDLGLKCNFYIKVNKGDQIIDRAGIHYSSVFMKYEDILKENLRANCILEINQEGAVGNTARFLEAVMYNKRLITNNLSLKESKFYNPKYICLYTNPEDINDDFFKENGVIDYNYNDEFSPLGLVHFIETIL